MKPGKTKPFAIYLKDFSAARQSYIVKKHVLDKKGRILDPFKSASMGGDLGLYFIALENSEDRKKLGPERLLHLIKNLPNTIYRAPKKDLTLGQYAVQQFLNQYQPPNDYLPDDCWIALAEKGSIYFEELNRSGEHLIEKKYNEILSYVEKLQTLKEKAQLEKLLAGTGTSAPKVSNRLGA